MNAGIYRDLDGDNAAIIVFSWNQLSSTLRIKSFFGTEYIQRISVQPEWGWLSHVGEQAQSSVA